MAKKAVLKPEPQQLADLSPLELTALAIAGKRAAKQRDELAEGIGQLVDLVVRIHGEIDVGPHQIVVKTDHASAAEAVALVLSGMGPRQKSAALRSLRSRLAERAAGRALRGEGYEALLADVDDVLRAGGGQRETVQRGAVTGALVVERVDAATAGG